MTVVAIGGPPHVKDETEYERNRGAETATPGESPAGETAAGLARRAGRILGRAGPADPGPPDRSERRAAADTAPGHLQRHSVRAADRLPVEDDAAGIRFRIDGPPPLPGVGPLRRVRRVVAAVPEGVRRPERHRLAVAGGGLGDGFSPRKRGDCVGKNPTDRAKLGSKRHVQTDGNGIPLNAALSGANDHDKTQLEAVLDRRVVPRPSPRKVRQHLCLDKGYDYPDTRRAVARRGYVPHIPHRGEGPAVREHPGGRARRWVVERTNRWHNLFRRLKIRYEVHAENYLGFVELACAIICFRRAHAR